MIVTEFLNSSLYYLERAKNRLSNYARNTDDYDFLRDIRLTMEEAHKELSAIERGDHTKTIYVGEEPYEPEPTECYCNSNNAPCNWCEREEGDA